MVYTNFLYKNRNLIYILNNILNCILVFKSIITNHFNLVAVCVVFFAVNLYAYNKISDMKLQGE
ncbi:hypothetical protein Ccar_06715 [Clostridium carboxidivorans P7]|uniref:Uncharacterized protein n=1 Tax=Clostridium carboxidivorans P7 TaxID=536227 RepID=C6PWD8_9CLOT|nr:hypothetical protein Ccar_06715 [Clostridium carboxidivorans P7]EET86415.1 hypothetical protein CcarbDRAFT_3105 [Clostridium carboxidivorans P7]EFG86277.1 hypothetical protein CLCAR_4102 [Clostridium carboxidivorans P7]